MIIGPEEIKKLYDEKLKYRLLLIEKTRKRVLGLIFSSFVTGAILFLSIKSHNSQLSIILWAALLLILVVSAISSYLKLKKQFKSKIIEELVKLIGPTWHFDHETHLNENRIFVSNIFDEHKIDRVTGDDYMEGVINGVSFKASEIKIEQRVQTNKKTKFTTIFRGLFMEVELPKIPKTETYIFSDMTEQVIGKWLGDMIQGLNFGRGELVKLENPDFEKSFRVHSDDQVQARVLLTPLYMEKLLKLKSKIKYDFHLAYHGGSLYIAVNMRNELLEPKLMSNMGTFAAVREAYNHLILPELFIETLVSEPKI